MKATNPKILRTAKKLSRILDEKGVAHALIGGLAVGMYGYNRATDDVDFLISGDSKDEIAGDGLGGEVYGKNIRFSNVEIDFLFPSYNEEFLEVAIRNAKEKGGLPVIPYETLIYMKLVAGRTRDNGDVVELLKRGKIDRNKVKSYLKKHRPDLVEDFESLAHQADIEKK